MTKTALITGAGRRLGLFLTKAFLDDGWRVIAFSRNDLAADDLALKRENLTVIALGDYSEDSVRSATEHAKKAFSKIDVVIHNASIYERDDTHSDDFYDFYEQLFHVHMRVPAQINHALQDRLFDKHSPGNIIHITDIYVDNPNADYALYCSTKAGLESLSKSFAKRLAPGVRVNAIQPGPIKFLEEHTVAQKNDVLDQTLLETEGGFLPIYQAVLSIVNNPYITGISIKVDGGRSLGRG